MTRHWRRVARVLIGVLLFAQLMVAAYACPLLFSQSPVDGPAAVADMDDGAVPLASYSEWGADGLLATIDPASPPLCGEHCKVGQQSDQTVTVHVPMPSLTLRYVIPPTPPAPSPRRPATAHLSALVAASPPHAILHCVLRT